MAELVELLDEAHAWLPLPAVLAWLQLDTDPAVGDPTGAVDEVRAAAADYVVHQRQDRIKAGADVDGDGQPDSATFVPTPRIVQAGKLATARLWARRSSPAGLASYGEFGPAEVLRLDPDVERLLGVGRYAAPAVG